MKQPLHATSVTLDADIAKERKVGHFNVFFDVTDIPTERLRSGTVSVPDFSQNKMAQLAASYGLSSSKRGSGTLLLWLRPNVMELVQRIVAGEDIQRIGEPTSLTRRVNELFFTRPPVSASTGSPKIKQDPWQIDLQKTFAGVLQDRPAKSDGSAITLLQRRLFELSVEVQALSLARAQTYILRSSDEGLSSLWLTSRAWEGVVLTSQQLPNPVVRKADVDKPRPMISILTVKKLTLLADGKKQNLSNMGVAVISPQD